MLLKTISSTTGRNVVYEFDVERMGTYPLRGMDRETAARWYGSHVAALDSAGRWVNARGVQVDHHLAERCSTAELA